MLQMTVSRLIQILTPKLLLAVFVASALMLISGSSIQAAPGDLDPSFNGNGKVRTDFFNGPDYGQGMVIQPDGKIIVAGYALLPTQPSSAGGGDFALARYNPDGSLDTSFGNGGRVTTDFFGEDVGLAVTLQPDGKIVMVGYGYNESFSSNDFEVVRYNPNGSPDQSFDGDGKVSTSFSDNSAAEAYSVVIQPDGKIVVVGVTDAPGGGANFALARYNPDGSLDAGFGNGGRVITVSNGNDLLYEVMLQADGKILAAGTTTQSISGIRDFALLRYNANGSLDSSFGVGGKVATDFAGGTDQIFGVAVQPDNKIVAAGISRASGSNNSDFALARYNPDGSLDTTFDTDGKVTTDFFGGTDSANELALQSNGKIVLGGRALSNSDSLFALARYNTDGSLDSNFGTGGKVSTDFFPGGNDIVRDLAIQSDGKIIAAGAADNGSGQVDFALTRYLGDAVAAPTSPELSIQDASLIEGGVHASSMIFTVSMSAASSQVVKVDFATASGTAMAGSDFLTDSGTLSFNPGETTKTILVYISTDFRDEYDEVLTVNLSNPVGATIVRGQGTGTILDDDDPPYVSINGSSSATEDNSGTEEVFFSVSISERSDKPISVDYSTVDDTATAPSDYQAVSGTLTFLPGESLSKGFYVYVNGDTLDEPDEYYYGKLSNPVNVTILNGQHRAVILNDDAHTVGFSISDFIVHEGLGFRTFTVFRNGDNSTPATVKYSTSDSTDANFRCDPNTANQATRVASRKCDYHIASGTLRFAPGETSKQFSISITDDVYVEDPEIFTLTLSNPVGVILGEHSSVPVTIADNDMGGAANPIDNTRFFVRQLYVDLLSREPDPAGWNGWTDRINLCGQVGQAPPPCDRVTVAGDGFLRSGEFFDRQFFVIRLYRTGLGRILRYEDVGDLAYVSGFLAAEQLELNKQDLVAEIVSRPEFAGRYNPLSNAAFVPTLLQTAGVTVPQSVQDDWVTKLETNQKSRAQVFREISERPEVSAKYAHEAQVVSAYYGFFTRNPDGAYLNYLQRLDSGEINLADLANAFINAQEYRQRFGQ